MFCSFAKTLHLWLGISLTCHYNFKIYITLGTPNYHWNNIPMNGRWFFKRGVFKGRCHQVINSNKWAPSLGRTGVADHHQPLYQNHQNPIASKDIWGIWHYCMSGLDYKPLHNTFKKHMFLFSSSWLPPAWPSKGRHYRRVTPEIVPNQSLSSITMTRRLASMHSPCTPTKVGMQTTNTLTPWKPRSASSNAYWRAAASESLLWCFVPYWWSSNFVT